MENRVAKNKLVDFYDSNEIIPVQQLGTTKQQERARTLLYNQLGLPPVALAGANVLEVGPGTGQNAIHLSSYELRSLLLVEPSVEGYRSCCNLLSNGQFQSNTKIINETLEQFRTNDIKTYDIVFCEGLVGSSGYRLPQNLLDDLASCVRRGGSLIITCEDEIGYLSETLRRYMARLLIDRHDVGITFRQQLQFLRPYFGPHLRTFTGSYKRRPDDWIADVILSPALDQPFLSIQDGLTLLHNEFKVIGTSPRIAADMTYYKVAAAMDENFENSSILNAYKTNIVNFLDYRISPCSHDQSVGSGTAKICTEVTELVKDRSVGSLAEKFEVVDKLAELRDLLPVEYHLTKETLVEWIDVLLDDQLTVEKFLYRKKLGSWFGRCQTYIHLARM